MIFDEQINGNPFSSSELTNPFFFEQSLLQPSVTTPQIERETKSQIQTSNSSHQFQLSYLHQMPSLNHPTSPLPYLKFPPLRPIKQKRLYYQWIQQHLIHQQWSNQLPAHQYVYHHIHCGHANLSANGRP